MRGREAGGRSAAPPTSSPYAATTSPSCCGTCAAPGRASRARIAAETGLNKATVSSLVAELAERGLVSEGETERGAVGRPGLVIELDTRVHVALGAEVSIDYASVLAMNLRGEPVAERRTTLDTTDPVARADPRAPRRPHPQRARRARRRDRRSWA